MTVNHRTSDNVDTDGSDFNVGSYEGIFRIVPFAENIYADDQDVSGGKHLDVSAAEMQEYLMWSDIFDEVPRLHAPVPQRPMVVLQEEHDLLELGPSDDEGSTTNMFDTLSHDEPQPVPDVDSTDDEGFWDLREDWYQRATERLAGAGADVSGGSNLTVAQMKRLSESR